MKTVQNITGLFLALIIFLVPVSCNRVNRVNDLIIHKGDFDATLMETGELLAVNARPVMMPNVGRKYGWQFKITGIIEHGTEVTTGDSVAQIDPSNIMKYLKEQTTMLETEQATLNKLFVEQAIKSQELEARLREVQANYNLVKLELEKFEFESKRKKEIKTLEFRQAEISLNQVKRAIELEKSIRDNSLIIQRIKVTQIERNVEEARTAIEKLTIVSPINGIFQKSKTWRTGQLFQVGDEIYIGQNIAVVPDLRKIKVKSTINETDIGKVKLGQKVVVRLEAYPDSSFQGKISEIGKLSYNKERDSRIKVFDTEIVLERSGQILKPGMTVGCEIYYEELKDVFYVSNSCLKRVDGTSYICMKEKNNWVDCPVRTGPSNNKYTVIYGQYKKGAELMIPTGEAIAINQ